MTPYQRYKVTRAESFEAFRPSAPMDLGVHRKTRWREAVGVPEPAPTLLTPRVAEAHAARLTQRYAAHISGWPVSEVQRRIRFLTVLHEVTAFTLEAVRPSVLRMDAALTGVIGASAGPPIWWLGAVEVEAVKMSLFEQIEAATEVEKRKRVVIEALSRKGLQGDVRAYVHFHGLVDVGAGHGGDARTAFLAGRLRARWPVPYAVELKATTKGQPPAEKIAKLASYFTKGGNERLHFKTGMGRERLEDAPAAEWRRGGTGRKARGGMRVADDRALSPSELKEFHTITYWLGERGGGDDGYLIGRDMPLGRDCG